MEALIAREVDPSSGDGQDHDSDPDAAASPAFRSFGCSTRTARDGIGGRYDEGPNRGKSSLTWAFVAERVTGIEPA